MNFISRSTLVLCVAISITACTTSNNNEVNNETNNKNNATEVTSVQSIECTDPRPQICTREYNPVCATVNTDIKCSGKHCPITKQATYATGCTACADPKVLNYMAGECEKRSF